MLETLPPGAMAGPGGDTANFSEPTALSMTSGCDLFRMLKLVIRLAADVPKEELRLLQGDDRAGQHARGDLAGDRR
jgi:hypothetical protein